MPLAGHGEVLGAVQPQPYRPSGQPAAERGDGREPMRLHLLAAEATAHPQALHGDLVALQAEDVRNDLLRLRRVLGAALDEDLAVLVDVRQRAVRLEVEVLLAGELELAAEHVVGPGEGGLDVAAFELRLRPLEALGLDGLAYGHERRQRLVLDVDREGAEPGSLQCLAEHPADRVAEEHDLAGEQRFVVLDAGIIDAGDVIGGEHANDAGHIERGFRTQPGDARVGVRRLQRIGVQAVLGTADEIVGIERGAGDVQRRGLVWQVQPDHRVRRDVRTGRSCGHLLRVLGVQLW